MALKVCPIPGCPTLVDARAYRGLCSLHRKQRDQQRGTAAQRGYGKDHRRIRAWWQARIDSGVIVTCWRCHKRITGRQWALDHSEDRTTYRGPACEQCNGHLAGRAAHGLEPD